VGLAQTERPQRGGLGLTPLVVDLVRRHDHRLPRPLQDPYDRLVDVRRAHRHVEYEQHDIGRAHSQLGLRRHPRRESLRVRVPAAGVDDREAPPVPVRVVRHPVPGHAGPVLHDRLAPADDAVD
jgi:hypothetical protein